MLVHLPSSLRVKKTIAVLNTDLYLVFLANEFFTFSGHPRCITVFTNFNFNFSSIQQEDFSKICMGSLIIY